MRSSEIDELSSRCARVVTHALEYVRQVEQEWISFLQRSSDGVHAEMRALRSDLARIESVRARYARVNEAVIEEEVREERRRLRERMENTLTLYRDADRPVIERSAALREAADALREAFAASYGRMDTRELMRLRQYFEYELARMQTDVLHSFVRRCVCIMERTGAA